MTGDEHLQGHEAFRTCKKVAASRDSNLVFLISLIIPHVLCVKAKQEESARERALCQLTECF